MTRFGFTVGCPKKVEKAAFQSHGVDIDEIEKIDTYVFYWRKFKETIHEIVKARALNRKDNSLEFRLNKALYSGDAEEADRLSALLDKRNRLNLHTL